MVSTVISKLELLTDETVMHRSKFHTYLQQETDTIFNFILNILLKGYGNWTFSKQLYNLYRLKPANRSLEQWKGDKELITHLKTTQGRRELFQRKVNQRLTELKGCYCKLTFGGGGLSSSPKHPEQYCVHCIFRTCKDLSTRGPVLNTRARTILNEVLLISATMQGRKSLFYA
jgi:hypothetical protein